MAGKGEYVTVEGHRLKLTSLDRVMYPETGTTKAEVLDYLARIAPVMLPHVRDRPATRKRWVHGVGTPDAPGQVFFQKNLDEGTPAWVTRREIQHSDGPKSYPLVNNLATLTWLGQIGALEIHVPQWRFGPKGAQRNPDRLVLDLDPGEGVGLAECAEVARLARTILTGMGLDPMPVTSGSKGIHLYAALDGKQSSDEVSAVAHELARALEADHPDLIVSDMKKTLRTGKVLVDWSQNNGNKTTIAPYSLRGRMRPTVAAPRTWRELASKNLRHLEFHEVLQRVAEKGDPLADLSAGHLEKPDRLAKYRGMRDAARTPEPVPSHPAPTSDGRSFVIQEHHARRLHYDFRLENDGVLVSWAVPKGIPTTPNRNNLAVQTEDHPLEYGEFEGTIPAGEYGAGEVTIWDSGTYDLEKWRENEEVIVILHGRPDGGLAEPVRVALIHTNDNNWLLHRMKDQREGHWSRNSKAHTHEIQDASAAERSEVPETRGRRTSSPEFRESAKYTAMLATQGTEAAVHDDADWAFEMKWDGIRALAYVSGGGIRLISRNGNDLTDTYPDLAELADRVRGDAVLDGEIVALNGRGRPDFGRLQERMNLARPGDVQKAARKTPVQFMVFDVLEVDGAPVVTRSYEERRDRLAGILTPAGRIHLPPAFEGNLEAAMQSSRELALEGVMAKQRDSQYVGRRSRAWIKIKHHLTQEVIIAGWRPGQGRRSGGVGSLLLAVPEDGRLRYVGRVGTGFRERDLDEMQARFARIGRKTSPMTDVPALDARDAHWLTPRFVGEVEFTEWTSVGRLRQPTWRGWRPDKNPTDVVKEG
ncbi:ATP-dependent DNA ligase [Salinibacterium sp. ZJ450]|uniref:ATP-dependent DNA ligase n=1 Tax=Salinibacterium sp. ZJ450 TaxID=2708338 RepID=UPI00141F41A7|nr:ATP-dependent DNA ligase [Salinibacterium sp. ZJ450]